MKRLPSAIFAGLFIAARGAMFYFAVSSGANVYPLLPGLILSVIGAVLFMLRGNARGYGAVLLAGALILPFSRVSVAYAAALMFFAFGEKRFGAISKSLCGIAGLLGAETRIAAFLKLRTYMEPAVEYEYIAATAAIVFIFLAAVLAPKCAAKPENIPSDGDTTNELL